MDRGCSLWNANERVTKNRDAMSKIVDCLKFCGKFELTLKGQDESTESENPGFFLGLVNFSCSLDSSLHVNLRSASVFKGSSKAISNELLGSILQVCKDQIRDEVKNFEYFAIIRDEATDIFCKTQPVIALRYIVYANPSNAFGNFLIRSTKLQKALPMSF